MTTPKLVIGLTLLSFVLVSSSDAFMLKKLKKAMLAGAMLKSMQPASEQTMMMIPMPMSMPMPVMPAPVPCPPKPMTIMEPPIATVSNDIVVVHDRVHHIDEFDMPNGD